MLQCGIVLQFGLWLERKKITTVGFNGENILEM